MNRKYIHIKEFANILGITTRTIYDWIKQGLIQHIQVKKGKIILIPKSEIKKLIKRNK